MSLLTDAMTTCKFMAKTLVPDGYGGYVIKYVEGTAFNAAVTFDNSIEARTAQAAGVTSVYTVTTAKSMTLQYHDVFKRVSDSKIFRVTSDGDDKYTPASASLNMRQVSAEEWTLPSEGE